MRTFTGLIIFLVTLAAFSCSGNYKPEIVYRVAGIDIVDITYMDNAGGTHRETSVQLPWEYKMNMENKTVVLYLKVDSQDVNGGIVKMYILIDAEPEESCLFIGNGVYDLYMTVNPYAYF